MNLFTCPFLKLSQDYISHTKVGDKNPWNFPKMHSHMHLFDDIEAKGVTRNYNTKPNENLHGPLKTLYKLQTNFKNVGQQVCI